MYFEGRIVYCICVGKVTQNFDPGFEFLVCYKCHHFCFRLYDWHDPTSLRTHSLPNQQFVRQEGSCKGHHMLDTKPVFPLGCESAPWQLSEATHDRGESVMRLKIVICKRTGTVYFLVNIFRHICEVAKSDCLHCHACVCLVGLYVHI
jgi:hypothetical protein